MTAVHMDHEEQFAEELQTLRALCDDALPRERRLGLMHSGSQRAFVVPEHQVVFESIRALLSLGNFSAAQLAVHLTRRGFPDIDAEKYFPRAAGARIIPSRSGKVAP